MVSDVQFCHTKCEKKIRKKIVKSKLKNISLKTDLLINNKKKKLSFILENILNF